MSSPDRKTEGWSPADQQQADLDERLDKTEHRHILACELDAVDPTHQHREACYLP